MLDFDEDLQTRDQRQTVVAAKNEDRSLQLKQNLRRQMDSLIGASTSHLLGIPSQ